MVIFSRNPVQAVLWLIVAFFNAAGLMVLVGAEFIAMLLVIVYVGAVAVLFLFVVMMLDIDFAELRAGFVKELAAGPVAGDCAGGRTGAWAWRLSRGRGQAGHSRCGGDRCCERAAISRRSARCSTPNISSCSKPQA